MPSSEQSERRFSLESEKPQHECGVFGIYAPGENVSRLTSHGLQRLQHRGQESAGIATVNKEGVIHSIRRMGLVRECFRDEEEISELTGFAAIGHTRYSNTGGSRLVNAQPAIYGNYAVSENGNLTNSKILRSILNERAIFPSTAADGKKCSSDGEIIVQAIASSPGNNTLEKIVEACNKFEGAYTLTVLGKEGLFAVRDPRGFWPLCLGSLNGSGFVVASESTSLIHVGAKYIREIEPGEILAITDNGLESLKLPYEGDTAECPFDWNYFRRPDSLINTEFYAYQFREMLGEALAKERPVLADVVIAEKDSGTYAAHGYSRASGIRFSEGSVKDPYSTRNFIEPDKFMRDANVSLKHSILEPEVRGKRVAAVSDSIVRGTQSSGFTQQLRMKGAKEVHWRLTFPKITDPCHFGIDTYDKEELIGAGRSESEVAAEIGADSVGYISPEIFEEVIFQVAHRKLDKFCTACFTGKYPIPVDEVSRDKYLLEQT